MVMVLHKFALLGGKVPAATGIRAAGRPPKAGRRTSFAAAAAPPACGPPAAPKTLPPPGAAVFGLFLSEGVRFLRLMFFRRLCTFCGRDRTDSPSPAKKSDWVIFIHPRRLSILGLCGGEEWFPSLQGQANGSFLSSLAACRFWAFAVGKKSFHPRKGKADGWVFYPLSPGSANCGVKSSPSRRRASSRAGCGGRAVK